MGTFKRSGPCRFRLATSRRRFELLGGIERLRHVPRIPPESRRARRQFTWCISPLWETEPVPRVLVVVRAAKCYSSGRRDDSGRPEIGEDLKGSLCSTAQADEAVYAFPQTPLGFSAASPHRIPDSTSELAWVAPASPISGGETRNAFCALDCDVTPRISADRQESARFAESIEISSKTA